MASLTKEQLKNELISHGVQPPIQSARKEEFVKLYEQHVAPIAAQKGDFSSDEEADSITEQKVHNCCPSCAHWFIFFWIEGWSVKQQLSLQRVGHHYHFWWWSL